METMNHECYVSLEVAKLLKEAGFDWKITSYYVRYYEGDGNDDSIPTDEFRLHISDNMYCADYNNTPLTYINGILHKLSAPTLEVAQRWLREVKKFHIDIQIMDVDNIKYGFIIHEIYEEKNPDVPFNNGTLHFVPFGLIYKGKSDKLFDTYEEAKEAGIKKALELFLEKGE